MVRDLKEIIIAFDYNQLSSQDIDAVSKEDFFALRFPDEYQGFEVIIAICSKVRPSTRQIPSVLFD